MQPVHRLLVVSHVVHYRYEGRIHAFGPYSREIDIWADLFPEVLIAAPVREGKPPGAAIPFERDNIDVIRQHETGGGRISDKVKQALLVPKLAFDLGKEMRKADVVHVRCPGNLGLLGAAIAPALSRYRIAKYAGQWNGYDDEPITVRAQRWLLRSRWWGAPVTVYGQWPDQPPHVVAFFTSMMTTEQMRRAREVAETKTLHDPLRVLSIGRLTYVKRVHVTIEAISLLRQRGKRAELRIVGDGPERADLESVVRERGLEDLVEFTGALSFEKTLDQYEWGDAFVLCSRHSEGWPKVLAEAMAHGLSAMAVAHGQIPTMLEGRGTLLRTGTPAEVAAALERTIDHSDEVRELTQHGTEWASGFSRDSLRTALRELMTDAWGVTLRG